MKNASEQKLKIQFLMFSAEPAEVGNMSGDSGFPPREGGEP